MSDILPRIIGVISGKGGVGKTTVVANLSTVLSKFKKNVTVIDCNVTTSHLIMHFGEIYYPKTLNDVLRDQASIKEATYFHDSGVKIVPASLNLSDLIGVDIKMLGLKMRNFFQDQDYVFLDNAAGFGKESISGMMACNEALLVATPYLPDITDIIRGKTILEELNVKILGLVLNKVTGMKFELKEEEISELTELPVVAQIPFDLGFLESLSLKVPLMLYNEKTDISREFFNLASSLTGEEYLPERIGILKRLARLFRK